MPQTFRIGDRVTVRPRSCPQSTTEDQLATVIRIVGTRRPDYTTVMFDTMNGGWSPDMEDVNFHEARALGIRMRRRGAHDVYTHDLTLSTAPPPVYEKYAFGDYVKMSTKSLWGYSGADYLRARFIEYLKDDTEHALIGLIDVPDEKKGSYSREYLTDSQMHDYQNILDIHPNDYLLIEVDMILKEKPNSDEVKYMEVKHTASITRKIDLEKDKHSLVINLDDESTKLLRQFACMNEGKISEATANYDRYRIKSVLMNVMGTTAGKIYPFFSVSLIDSGKCDLHSMTAFPDNLDKIFSSLVEACYKLLRNDTVKVEVKVNDQPANNNGNQYFTA